MSTPLHYTVKPLHAAISGPFAAALATLESMYSGYQTAAARAGNQSVAQVYGLVLAFLDKAHIGVKAAGNLNPDIAARCIMAYMLSYIEVEREIDRARTLANDSIARAAVYSDHERIFTAVLYDMIYARLQPASAARGGAIAWEDHGTGDHHSNLDLSQSIAETIASAFGLPVELVDPGAATMIRERKDDAVWFRDAE